ncbi:MAG: chromosomal replication initiator protein DnaA [Deltaproteobacteria bacterium]|nr:MAG: chromosomal replication initiator protein DnaA [Deltaproteobacteria bacterium]
MEAVWKELKAAIKERIPFHSYRMWIEPTKFSDTQDGLLVLTCPNFFSKKRVQENYKTIIEGEIKKTLGKSREFSIIVAGKNGGTQPNPGQDRQLALPNMNVRPHCGHFLNKYFTFDHFVVGDCNEFAFSASLSFASRKTNHQNSLYLLSNTGLGKSHLSQAIGHHILSEQPNDRVFYITAEDFSNEMVRAYRNDCIEKFKGKYRNGCDVLLLEDVHHLSGKERTQIELALTLDFLFETEKRIIFSSCYLPGEIPKLNDKLRSRLLSGLISKIDPPNFRTRVRILQRKSIAKGFIIPEDVLHYLAAELTEDVRQLESGLIGVAAKSSLLCSPINLGLAESVVKNIVRQRKRITIEAIKKLVCKYYNISINDIVSRSRKQGLVRPRQIAIYLSRKYTDSPLQAIGRSFNRYHATALHSINTIEVGLNGNSAIKKQVEFFRQKLESGKF